MCRGLSVLLWCLMAGLHAADQAEARTALKDPEVLARALAVGTAEQRLVQAQIERLDFERRHRDRILAYIADMTNRDGLSFFSDLDDYRRRIRVMIDDYASFLEQHADVRATHRARRQNLLEEQRRLEARLRHLQGKPPRLEP